MDLSSFIKDSCSPIISEGIRSRDIEKAMDLINRYLLKRKIYTVQQIFEMKVENKPKMVVLCWTDKNECAAFIWDMGRTAQIEACGFSDNFDEIMVSLHFGDIKKLAWKVYVEAKGANTVQMCKMVESVLTGKTKMEIGDIRNLIADAQLFESLDGLISQPLYEDDAFLADLKRKKGNLYQRLNDAKKKGQTEKVASLQKEYDEIVAQLNGARADIRGNVSTSGVVDSEVVNYDKMFEDEVRATPEERFDDMKSYIFNVVKGIRPLALLCGAPGVGKTFRVMEIVKTTKSQIHGGPMQRDVDYKVVKGKCTPTALFTSLHDFKEEGQLLIFDDCDSIFKDGDAINLLKAAYDSSDERIVSWNTSAAIPMPVEDGGAPDCDDAVFDASKGKWYYPKDFIYNGSGIIITNFSAGQLDTAVRNRALICDLNFTVEEVLELVRGIAPKIKPGVISDAAKEKAMEYLKELADKKVPMEISIRSFTLCAGMFDEDAPEAAIKRRINEQMRLQFARGGKKY